MRVIKLGGSLLEFPALRSRLPEFLYELSPPKPTIILVGGGNVVEAIRRYDNQWQVDEVDCHWLCVELMNSTARLLKLLFPDWPLIADPRSLADWLVENRPTKRDHRPLAIVSPAAFYSPTINADSLPTSWQTTSDSIAALLARVVHGEELILLKSVDPPPAVMIKMQHSQGGSATRLKLQPVANFRASELAQIGSLGDFIDAAFLDALAPNIRIGFVNLNT